MKIVNVIAKIILLCAIAVPLASLIAFMYMDFSEGLNIGIVIFFIPVIIILASLIIAVVGTDIIALNILTKFILLITIMIGLILSVVIALETSVFHIGITGVLFIILALLIPVALLFYIVDAIQKWYQKPPTSSLPT